MKDHAIYEEWIPQYAAGLLAGEQKTELEAHLASCSDCRMDLDLWKAVSNEIVENNRVTAPAALPRRVLERVHAPGALLTGLRQAWQLLRAQALLVRSEMWLVSALIMAIGILVGVIAEKIVIVYILTPVVAATTLSLLYGAENDPAIELSQSTQTSPWKILLARMSIVSGYNVLLGVAASSILLLFLPAETLGTVIFGWFSPLAFLSSLALLLSIWFGAGLAVTLSYCLWLVQYLPLSVSGYWLNTSPVAAFLASYKGFWSNPTLLLSLSVLLAFFALWSVNKPVIRASVGNPK